MAANDTENLVTSLRALYARPRGGKLRPQWRWLADALRYRRGRVALRVLRDETSGQTPDCARCTDHCCKGPHEVALRLEDVARLKDAGLGWAIVAPGDSSTEYEEPTLKHDEKGVCVFLDGNQRCTIYEQRPIVCRRFPFFVAEDARTLRYAESCRSRVEGNGAELRAAAVESYNQRLRDYLLIRRMRQALVRLGVLDGSKDTGARFQAALTRTNDSG